MIGRVALSSALLLCLCAPSAAQDWPPTGNGLEADPAIRFARLDNGVRVATQRNAEPPGRVALRLVVQVGSREENDDERGAAHFVEHMAFNGTRRFPGNTIQGWLRDRGMAMQMHANAETSFDRTVYRLDLPSTDEAAIADGLDVLRQFVDGVLFDAAEVEAEKGVIDAEERERPREEYAELQRIDRIGAGGRRAMRPVLGTAAERARFTPESLRAFHTRWYRPDNLIVLVVGDLDPAAAERLCRDVFGPLPKPTLPFPERASLGKPSLADTSFSIDDATRSDVAFVVLCPVVCTPGPDSAEARGSLAANFLLNELVRGLLARRLLRQGSPVLGVEVTSAREAHLDPSIDSMVVRFTCKPADSEGAVTACSAAMVAVLEAGLSDAAFADGRATVIAEMGRVPSQRTSPELARALVSSFVTGRVPTALETQQDSMQRALSTLDTKTLTTMLRTAWFCDVPSITSVGPPGHAIDAPEVWRTAAATMRRRLAERAREAVPTDATRNAAAVPEWPYAATGAGAPAPASRSRMDAIDVEDVRMPNGVRLLVKPNRSAARVAVSVSLGGGTMNLDQVDRHAALAFSFTSPELALGRIDRRALRSIVSSHDAALAIVIGQGRFDLRGETGREDLGFQMELLCAVCADPGTDAESIDRVVRSYVTRHPAGAPEERIQTFLGALAGTSVAVSGPLLRGTDAERIRAFLLAHWVEAPITVAVAGDVVVDEVVAAVSRTFGTLPARRPITVPPYRELRGGVHETVDLAATERAGQVVVCAPLDAEGDRGNLAALRVLGRVVRERVTTRVREVMGAAYSPSFGVGWLSAPFPSTLVLIRMQAAPGREEELRAATMAELAAVHRDGATDAEVAAAVKQLLNEVREQRAANEYWLAQFGDVHTGRTTLEDLATFERDLANATTAAVGALATRYFAAERLSTLVLRVPAPK